MKQTMKKTLIIVVAFALALTACASDDTAGLSTEQVGATISDLASEAQSTLNGADVDARLASAVQAVSDHATTVGLAATAGEVSDQDLDALVGSLDDFESQLDAATDSLDPAVQDSLDDLAKNLRDAIDQLNS